MKNKLNFLQNLFNLGKDTNEAELFSSSDTEDETIINESAYMDLLQSDVRIAGSASYNAKY